MADFASRFSFFPSKWREPGLFLKRGRGGKGEGSSPITGLSPMHLVSGKKKGKRLNPCNGAKLVDGGKGREEEKRRGIRIPKTLLAYSGGGKENLPCLNGDGRDENGEPLYLRKRILALRGD